MVTVKISQHGSSPLDAYLGCSVTIRARAEEHRRGTDSWRGVLASIQQTSPVSRELQLGGGLDLELTVKDVDEFCALEDLRGELALVAIGKEFSETGDDMAVRDE